MKYVNMTEALRQVREKAPNTADAMARHKAGNAGFTDKAHLKAKGLIPRSDGTKKVSPKYEETCPEFAFTNATRLSSPHVPNISPDLKKDTR